MEEKILENEIEKIKEFSKEVGEKQKAFLETNIGQAINTGLNFGLKVLLPDFIENDVIEIKDSLFQGGFKEAINTTINNTIDLGKSFLGIFTGNFESISQIKTAIEKGGLIDGISDVLDLAINWAKKEGFITSSTAKTIKSGKKEIMQSIKNGIDNTLEEQIEAIEKIDGYIEKWKKYYNEKNFTNMEYQYKKIEEYMKKIIPLEKLIKEAREIQNTHILIKNNGKNFNLSEEEKSLTKLFAN